VVPNVFARQYEMTTLQLLPYYRAEVLEVTKDAAKYNYYMASQFRVLYFGAGTGTFTLPAKKQCRCDLLTG
jgi:hypothetical protein